MVPLIDYVKNNYKKIMSITKITNMDVLGNTTETMNITETNIIKMASWDELALYVRNCCEFGEFAGLHNSGDYYYLCLRKQNDFGKPYMYIIILKLKCYPMRMLFL